MNPVHSHGDSLHIVEVSTYDFTPEVFEVEVGDTVRWILQGDVQHSTTSTDVPDGADSWSELLTTQNQTFDYVVPVEGLYQYHCFLHPHLHSGTFYTEGFEPNALHSSLSWSAIDFSFYPNPVSDILNISAEPGGSAKFKVTIFDMQGRHVKSWEGKNGALRADVSNVSEGQYVLRIIHDSHILSETIVIR